MFEVFHRGLLLPVNYRNLKTALQVYVQGGAVDSDNPLQDPAYSLR